VANAPLSLTTKQGRAELQERNSGIHEQLRCRAWLVIIDPLKNALGGDDSDSELMSQLNAAVLGLIAAHCCTVLRVHHSGIQTRAAAWTFVATASVDTEIRIADGAITGTKQRDDAKAQLHFKLTVVTLGTDTDGDPVRTCIVEPRAPRREFRPPIKLGSHAERR